MIFMYTSSNQPGFEPVIFYLTGASSQGVFPISGLKLLDVFIYRSKRNLLFVYTLALQCVTP